MGFYIETGDSRNKATWLVNNAGGTIVSHARPTTESIPVVVLDNGPFEAAGVAYDADELAAFTDPGDFRRKTIVMVPRTEVVRLCPHVASRLDW